MQINLTAEQEAQLSQIAAHEGKGADELYPSGQVQGGAAGVQLIGCGSRFAA
jgi:hypothetical protein